MDPPSQSQEPGRAEVRIALKPLRPPSLTRPLWVALPLLAVIAYSEVRGEDRADLPLLLVLLALGVVGPLVFGLLERRKVGPREVWLREDGLGLPLDRGASKVFPWGQVESAHVFEGRTGRLLLVQVARATVVLRDTEFVDPRQLRELHDEIRRQVATQPGGVERLQSADERARAAGEASAIHPYATQATVGLLWALFAVELAAGAPDDPLALLRLGAGARALVLHGETYRLVTSSFLHAGVLHILLNSAAILSLGSLMERLLGRSGYLAVYCGSALAGAATSVWLMNAPASVGASTAAFGLLGAMLCVHVRYWHGFPTGFRQSVRWWLVILALNSALPMVVRQIDWAGHLGGFVAGLAIAGLFTVRVPRLPLSSGPNGWRTFVAGALAAVCAAGLAVGANQAARDDETDQTRRVASFAEDKGASPGVLNELAWATAVDPHSSRARLHEAVRAATSAAQRTPEGPEQAAVLDTLATAHYRLDQFDVAVATELRALQGRDDAVLRSQLARFLAAYARSTGAPYRVGPGATVSSATVTAAGDLEFEVAEEVAGTWSAYAVAEKGGKVVGLLRWPVDPGPAGHRTVEVPLPWSAFDAARLVAVLGEPGAKQAWPMDAIIGRLP